MSQTFTSSADWSEFIHSTPPSSVFSDHIHSATAIPAPTTDPNPNTFSFNSAPPPSSNIPATNRTIRVTKPARKRSRASRRTPTTLLSTDTSNFRAMVQQFTGGPSALGYQIGGTVDQPHLPRVNDQPLHISGAEITSSSMFATASSGYHFHSNHQLPPQQHYPAYGSGEMEHSRLMIATSSAASAPNHSNSFLY